MKRLLIKFTPFFLFFFFYVTTSSLSYAKAIDWNHIPDDLVKEVLKEIPNLNSNSPSLEEMDLGLRFLMSHGSFESLEITEEEQSYQVHFKTLKTIHRIIVEGMVSFDSSEIEPLIPIEKGQKFEARWPQEIKEKLNTFYTDQGYLNAVVSVETNTISESLIELRVKIQEGSPLRIGSINIKCANPDLLSRLERIVQKNVGKIYNPQLMSEIPKQMQEYFRDHSFILANTQSPLVSVDPSKTSVNLTYTIERSEQYSISFEGNNMMPTPRLISEIEFTTLLTTNPNPIPELKNKLRDFYFKKGYARVEIQGEIKILRPFVRSLIVFNINEGLPVKIEKLEIQGSYSRSKKYYENFLKNQSGDTISKGFFHRSDFEAGLKSLLIDRQNEGYLRAKIVSSRYIYNQNKDRMTLSVTIDEGPMTRVEDIRFSGLKSLNSVELKEVLQFKNGEPLKLNELEQGLENIKTFAKEKGFLEFKILNEKENLVIYNNENTLATLDFVIEEGPQVKVHTIVLDGNHLTKDYVLRKELDFEVGDTLTPSKMEESTRRLQKLGLFNSVEIKTLEQNSSISERTIVVNVSERNPGLFNVGVGVTNERVLTLRGFAGIAYRNIKGTARAISTRAEINYNVADIQFPEMKLNAGYLEPYLFDTRTKGRINLTRSIQVVDYQKRTGLDTYQADFLLEQNLTSHILFTYDLWSYSQIRKIDKNAKALQLPTNDAVLNLASTGPAIEFDYRDHPFNPTRGTFSRLQTEYSNPFLGNSRTIEFLKSTATFTHYYPISQTSPLIFANSLRFGEIKNLSAKDGVPFDKKGFVLGGLSTIRGFEAGTNERFPNDTDLLLGPDETYFIKDRNQFALFKSELRFPIWGSVGGAIFYDGGIVTVDDIQFKDPYRDAAGFGIRYATPVGPANIEFAWKLDCDKSRGESPFRVHISIGTF